MIQDYVIGIDFETTGLEIDRDEIIEIGAVRLRIDTWQHVKPPFSELVKPPSHMARLAPKIKRLTKIKDHMLENKLEIRDQWPDFINTIMRDGGVFIAHNSYYEAGILWHAAMRHNLEIPDTMIYDSLELARLAFGDRKSHKLSDLVKDLGINVASTHRAYDDCIAMMSMVRIACERLKTTFREIMPFLNPVPLRGTHWIKGQNGWFWVPA